MRGDGLREEEDAAHVEVHDAVVVGEGPNRAGGRSSEDGCRARGAGVVDEDVDGGAEGGEARGDDVGGRVERRDVGLDGEGVGAVVESADRVDEGGGEGGAAGRYVRDGDLILEYSGAF